MSPDAPLRRLRATSQILTPPSGTTFETPSGKNIETPSGNKSRCTASAGTAPTPSGHNNNLVNNFVTTYSSNSNIATFLSSHDDNESTGKRTRNIVQTIAHPHGSINGECSTSHSVSSLPLDRKISVGDTVGYPISYRDAKPKRHHATTKPYVVVPPSPYREVRDGRDGICSTYHCDPPPKNADKNIRWRQGRLSHATFM